MVSLEIRNATNCNKLVFNIFMNVIKAKGTKKTWAKKHCKLLYFGFVCGRIVCSINIAAIETIGNVFCAQFSIWTGQIHVGIMWAKKPRFSFHMWATIAFAARCKRLQFSHTKKESRIMQIYWKPRAEASTTHTYISTI